MTAPNRPEPVTVAEQWTATINTAADILREYIARESPDMVRLLFNADYEGMAMALEAAGRLTEPEPVNDIDATGECCCNGCIGMGPCDLDLGRPDLDEDAERDCRCGDICTCDWEDDDD